MRKKMKMRRRPLPGKLSSPRISHKTLCASFLPIIWDVVSVVIAKRSLYWRVPRQDRDHFQLLLSVLLVRLKSDPRIKNMRGIFFFHFARKKTMRFSHRLFMVPPHRGVSFQGFSLQSRGLESSPPQRQRGPLLALSECSSPFSLLRQEVLEAPRHWRG